MPGAPAAKFKPHLTELAARHNLPFAAMDARIKHPAPPLFNQNRTLPAAAVLLLFDGARSVAYIAGTTSMNEIIRRGRKLPS